MSKTFCLFAFNLFCMRITPSSLLPSLIILCFILIWSNLILRTLTLNYLHFVWLNAHCTLASPFIIILLPFHSHCHCHFLFFCYCSSFIVQLIFLGMKTFWNVFGCDLFVILSGAAGVSSLTTCHVFLFIFISDILCHSHYYNRSLVNRKWFYFYLEFGIINFEPNKRFTISLFVQLCHSAQHNKLTSK